VRSAAEFVRKFGTPLERLDLSYCTAGNNNPTRIPMIEITTKNGILNLHKV